MSGPPGSPEDDVPKSLTSIRAQLLDSIRRGSTRFRFSSPSSPPQTPSTSEYSNENSESVTVDAPKGFKPLLKRMTQQPASRVISLDKSSSICQMDATVVKIESAAPQ